MHVEAIQFLKRRRGRPSSFTPERAEKLLAAVRKGVPYVHAAAAAGISFDTFNRWRQKGENGEGEEYCEFCEQLAQAESEAVSLLVGRIMEASRKDWRAAVWMLQRRFPKEWSEERRENNPKSTPSFLETVNL